MKQNQIIHNVYQTNDSKEFYRDRVVAVVVTYNPNLALLEKCLASIREQVYKIVIVDNASKNVENIIALSKKYECDFIENGFNAGVPYALKRGVEYSLRYSPTWILFLDQDSIVYKGAITKALELYSLLPSHLRARIGILALGQEGSPIPCRMREVAYHTFSGTLIKTNIALNVQFRINFFLDQADFDLYYNVRKCKLKTILIDCKLMEHRIGIPINFSPLSSLKKFFINFLKKIGITELGNIVISDKISTLTISYEKPMRYYYIVRNSLILLKENKKDIISFIIDVCKYGLAIIYIDGFMILFRMLIYGMAHGLAGKEGYLEIRM
jgi:rhamnosyltransferase